MAREKKASEKMNTAAWMNTYADLVTLLLCFFVMLFAMSNIDAKKFESIVAAFSGSTGVLDGGESVVDMNRIVNEGGVSEQAQNAVMEMQTFEDMKNDIQEYLKQNNLSSQVNVINDKTGLLLRFQDNVLFDSGSANLGPSSVNILNYIAQLLKSDSFKDKFINIEGHTDDVPISSPKYASNWELSVGRASSVVRYLVEEKGIEPKRISASGYSEYHPVNENNSDQNRAKNRRVDIMIMKSKDLQNSNYLD